MTSGLADTPPPPYYAVVFTSALSGEDEDGYAAMADEMRALAAQQPGYLGIETVRGPDGVGITVSYWESEAAIAAWRDNARHAVARKMGRETWYGGFRLRVARVERAYGT